MAGPRHVLDVRMSLVRVVPVATLLLRVEEFNSVNMSYSMPAGLSAREQSQAPLIDSYNCRHCVLTKC